MVRRAGDSGVVRHLVLTLLTAFALVASGFSATAEACPMLQAAAAQAWQRTLALFERTIRTSVPVASSRGT